MSTVVITLDSSFLHRMIDLEIPGEVVLRNLLPELVRALQLPAVDNVRRPIVYQLVHRQRPLRETESLLEAGVVTGDTPSLVSVSQIGATSGEAGMGHWGASALLRCPSGEVIVLDSYGKPGLTIGRQECHSGWANQPCPTADTASSVWRPHYPRGGQAHLRGWPLIAAPRALRDDVDARRCAPACRLLSPGVSHVAGAFHF